MDMTITNYDGGVVTAPQKLVRHESVEELRAILQDTERFPSPVRAMGSFHSVTPCASSSGTVVNMSGLKGAQGFDTQKMTFTAQAGLQLVEAAEILRKHDLQFMRYIFFVLGLVVSVAPISRVFAQEEDLGRQPGQPPEVQVVQTKELTVVTLAGVGPQDKDGKLAAPGDFAAQFKQTWENLRRLMAGAGSQLKNIVSITVYTTDAKWQDTFKELQEERFSDWNPATSFAVSQQLRTPGALLEIHAVAVIDNRKPVRR